MNVTVNPQIMMKKRTLPCAYLRSAGYFNVSAINMSLKRAKKADGIFQKAVFGFTREHGERESIIIPTIIKYLILNYYLLEDRFEHHGKCISLQGNGSIACKQCCKKRIDTYTGKETWCSLYMCHKYDVAYGQSVVGVLEEGIAQYEWTIQFDSNENCFTVGLGTKTNEKREHYSFPLGMYGLLCAPCEVDDGVSLTKVVDGEGIDMYDEKWEHVHAVKMCLDMEKEQLLFFVKGKLVLKIGGADGFKIEKFRLIIMLIEEGDSARVTNFKIKHG